MNGKTLHPPQVAQVDYSMNQVNQMNQMNQMDQMNQQAADLGVGVVSIGHKLVGMVLVLVPTCMKLGGRFS